MTVVPPVTTPVLVTPANAQDVLRTLPFLMRRALRLAARLHKGELHVCLPDQRHFIFKGTEDGPKAELMIHSYAFARRLALGGDIGLAESYLQGEWDSPNLTAFIQLFAVNYSVIASLLSDNPLARLWQSLRHMINRNTKSGSRRNIHAHYDLGNRFYSAWLDESMTYSSALFVPDDHDLTSAQMRKYRTLSEDIELDPSHHVLEIGCGWGGFAEFAAREIGCKVTGLTISKEQYDYATQRLQKAGLSDKVEIKLLDYRDETGLYDRIVSIEMFEAVGEEFWDRYFEVLHDRLKPGGRAGLQVITLREESFRYYKGEMDFIRRYVFPGGMLPTPSIMKNLGDSFSVPITAQRVFGLDYAKTLSLWRDRFRETWPSLQGGNFDERFRRLWEYYLSYCEAGFRSGNIDVRQLIHVRR
jgi:cyclopropane-fatty-acyl-phospholipid synthase